MNHGGQIIEAEKAVPGQPHQCIGCGKAMLVRHGPKRRTHFAHTIEVENCQPETVLHQLGKLTVKSGIETALAQGREYPLKWRCSVCRQLHQGNLAISPRKILEEYFLEDIRPDLLAVSEKGKPLAAIEIIVSHEPELSTLEEYRRIKLPVILVRPTMENYRELFHGLNDIEVLNGACLAKKCPKCSGVMQRILIQVCHGYECYKCKVPMPVIDMTDEDSGYTIDTTPGMIGAARELEIKLQIKYSHTTQSRYPMHICPACGMGQGNWYITAEKYVEWTPVPDENLKAKYYCCEHCDLWEKQGT
jgi:hypothetical protein